MWTVEVQTGTYVRKKEHRLRHVAGRAFVRSPVVALVFKDSGWLLSDSGLLLSEPMISNSDLCTTGSTVVGLLLSQ